RVKQSGARLRRGDRRRGAVLLAAIVLRQRDHDGTALAVALGVGAPALDAGKVRLHGVEVRPHLLDLGVERAACGRLATEQHEKAVFAAAGATRQRLLLIDLDLLLADRFLVAAGLFDVTGVGGATVEGCELALEPRAIGAWLGARHRD